MTIEEARKNYEKYKREISWDQNHTNEDALIEVTEFLLQKTNDPWYSSDLGGYYYEKCRFDLALKYYELTYELGEHEIASCLGYIWYYGRTGTVDYEKAYRYFQEAAQLGDSSAKYKIADMYRNGYYVGKNYEKYCEIIEDLYEEHKNDEYPFIDLPDICTRLAGIRSKQGRCEEALELYEQAKELLPKRLFYTGFFGDINVMEGLINELYQLTDPDYSNLDLFDLFELLKQPCTVAFCWNGKKYRVRSSEEDGEYGVEFLGRWYRSVNDLFKNAVIGERPLYALYGEIYGMEVE